MILYYSVRHRAQNIILLFASYIFYGWWDWRFLTLIALSSVIDYFIGRAIHNSSNEKKRKLLVTASLCSNLSILGFFKYFNFFADSFTDLFNTIGFSADWVTLNIILPVGISFYTFQTLSYTIDIYRKKLTPEKRFLDFALFVSFFPQLVAGPIERAAHLLPQITTTRQWTSEGFMRGVYLILFGLFKKVAIADSAAVYVNEIFNADTPQAGINIAIATVLFAVQIYCDFSGYTDIARGIAKTLGFDFRLNFNLPYFSKNPQEFWQRWHISLSSWLRDYLYISLGGNKYGAIKTYRNLMITMLLGGLWHGAAWNFVIWGFYQGAILIIHRLIRPGLEKVTPAHPIFHYVYILLFFVVTCYGWLIFRAESMDQIANFSTAIIFNFNFNALILPDLSKAFLYGFPLLLTLDLFQYKSGQTTFYRGWPIMVRYSLYSSLIVLILVGTGNSPEQFIYFQF